MTDRIDTDAIRTRFTGAEYLSVETEDAILALCDEVDRLRALAVPAPVGLTEQEQKVVAYWRAWKNTADIVAIVDRLSAAPVDDRERVPEGWRVEPIFGFGTKTRVGYRLVPVSPSVDPEEEP